MNIQEAIDMFGRTRTRLPKVLEKCDDNILDFKPEMKMQKGGSFHKARSILRHIADAESYWLHSKVQKRKEYPHYDFSNKNLKEILEVLHDVRKEMLDWLKENKDTDLNKPHYLKAKNQLLVFYATWKNMKRTILINFT